MRVRGNLSILPTGTDGEVGYVCLLRRAQKGRADDEVFVRRSDRALLGGVLERVAHYDDV